MKINRSSKSGKFVDKKTAENEPDTTVTETISPAADLIRHVREALCNMPEEWREVFTKDLARLDG